MKELRAKGEETWASVSISSSTNIRHLAMSATKLVLEWTKMVTFIATLITFLLGIYANFMRVLLLYYVNLFFLVLQLDSLSHLPPLKYTFLTLTYYLVMEDKIKLSNKCKSYAFTFDQIQGLEPLYFQLCQTVLTICLNILLLLPLIRSNAKLCLVTLYHNVYLQYKNFRRHRDAIHNEWERISMFRVASPDEIEELDDVCAVCLNPLLNQVRVTKCRHYFHANCLRLYLKESNLDSCPICKRTL